jgi:hypothetical protein
MLFADAVTCNFSVGDSNGQYLLAIKEREKRYA